jgi:HlyD family secretion protein
VPNADLKLKPGMTANVTIEIARADDVLRVPNAALRFRPPAEVFTALGQQAPREDLPASAGGSARGRVRPADAGTQRGGVWMLRDGGLVRVPVKTGVNDGTMTAVTGEGLQEGAQIATAVAVQPGTVSATQGSGSPLLPQRMNRTRTQGARR